MSLFDKVIKFPKKNGPDSEEILTKEQAAKNIALQNAMQFAWPLVQQAVAQINDAFQQEMKLQADRLRADPKAKIIYMPAFCDEGLARCFMIAAAAISKQNGINLQQFATAAGSCWSMADVPNPSQKTEIGDEATQDKEHTSDASATKPEPH